MSAATRLRWLAEMVPRRAASALVPFPAKPGDKTGRFRRHRLGGLGKRGLPLLLVEAKPAVSSKGGVPVTPPFNDLGFDGVSPSILE